MGCFETRSLVRRKSSFGSLERYAGRLGRKPVRRPVSTLLPIHRWMDGFGDAGQGMESQGQQGPKAGARGWQSLWRKFAR